jgi:hypothetical protein
LLYGSETWTIKARDARRITAAEMKYMRRTAKYIWTDYKTHTQIAKELKITQILDKLLEYKGNWIQHVNRMPRNRLPRVMKHFPNWQKESWQTVEETSESVRPERVNKWPNSISDMMMMMMMMMVVMMVVMIVLGLAWTSNSCSLKYTPHMNFS